MVGATTGTVAHGLVCNDCCLAEIGCNRVPVTVETRAGVGTEADQIRQIGALGLLGRGAQAVQAGSVEGLRHARDEVFAPNDYVIVVPVENPVAEDEQSVNFDGQTIIGGPGQPEIVGITFPDGVLSFTPDIPSTGRYAAKPPREE